MSTSPCCECTGYMAQPREFRMGLCRLPCPLIPMNMDFYWQIGVSIGMIKVMAIVLVRFHWAIIRDVACPGSSI